MKKVLLITVLICNAKFLNAAGYGYLSGGVPVVTISFNDFDNYIDSLLSANGMYNVALDSMKFIYTATTSDTDYFQYKYHFTDASANTYNVASNIAVLLNGNNEFMTIPGGGKKSVSCFRLNCQSDECRAYKNIDCVPNVCTNPDPDKPTGCMAVETTTEGGGVGPWIPVITAFVNWLLGKV